MLAVCAATGRRIWYSARQIALAAVVGILLLMGGNLTSHGRSFRCLRDWRRLIIAITPLWFLVLDSLLLGHHHISGRGKAGLALGIVGLFVLFWPELHSTSPLGRRELWASLALIGGSFFWALGSVLSKRWQSGMDVFSATGWQMTAAGVANFLFAAAGGRLLAGGVDDARVGRGALSGGVRIVDRIHGLHLAAGACADVEGVDLCVCESGGRGVSGMADSARASGPLHCDGQCDCGGVGDSGDQREG